MGVPHQGDGGAEAAGCSVGVDTEPLDGHFGGDALTADARLFGGEEFGADVVGVVRVEQFALLAFESGEILGGSLQLDGAAAGDLVEPASQVPVGLQALGVSQGYVCVVALDGCFDGFGPVVGLTAGLGLPAGADEVLVEAAVAAVAGVDQASSAVGAVQ